MNFKTIVATTLAAATLGWAANGLEQRRIGVCLDMAPNGQASVPLMIASKIFSRIDVSIDWKYSGKKCAASDIHIHWSTNTLANDHPGALAYATPAEGVTVVIFLDRVNAMGEPRLVSAMLGHVLAHEIGHILQGVCRHSNSGVMKVNFTLDDRGEMLRHSMTFLPYDATLIHQGIDARAARLMAFEPQKTQAQR